MAQHYLFRCSSCEKDFEITEKQAGTIQDCQFCENSNNLPGMREIRQLPVAEASTGNSQHGDSEAKSWLFSGGLLVAVVAGLLAFALLGYANSITTESRVVESIELGQAQIKPLQSGLLWEAWDNMTQTGLPEWVETPEIRYNKQAGYLSMIAYGLFGASAIGLTAMALSFMASKR